MLSFDIKFLTTDESIYLKSNDFNGFKYETKKRTEESIYEASKRSYCERRGGKWRAPRPGHIRQLESKLRDKAIITCEWTYDSLITIVFSSGVIAYLSVKQDTLDVTQILFDRYFVGKLPTQTITSVALCKTLIFFTHTDKTGTLVTFGKNSQSHHPCRISDREPHLQSVELGGGLRKTDRRVSWSESETGVLILVWSITSMEPAPWSPIIEDCANLHLYQVKGQNMLLTAYHQLENETLSAELSFKQDSMIHIVEQSPCPKNGVSLDWIRYEIGTHESTVKLSSLRDRVTRAVLAAPARTTRRSACDTRLLSTCIDGSLHVIHHIAGLTHSVKVGFIASDVRWSGQLVLCADEAGRLHCYDRALSLLHNNAKCHDLSQYVRDAHRMQILATDGAKYGSCVLASFSGGPLLLFRIMHPRLLTAWIRARRTSNAVALLRAMDWEVEGTECLWAVNKLVCVALRSGAEAVGEEGAAQAALGAFLAPPAPHPPHALRYAPHLTDLARKFFHHLLRRGRIEKALSLAVDLAAWDLFVDARCAAKRRHLEHLADEAATLAATYAAQEPHDSECSDSCSRCSSASYSESEGDPRESVPETAPPPLPRVAIHPHLPALVPVTRSRNEPISTTSIRPNLHQYLDRDNSIWNRELRDDSRHDTALSENFKSSLNVRSVRWNDEDFNRRTYSGLASISENSSDPIGKDKYAVTRSRDDRFQSSLSKVKQSYRMEPADVANTLYRYRTDTDHHTANRDRRFENVLMNERSAIRTSERNKVKFSDTVTIAVVSDPPQCPEPARELAESLPLCPPHNYLAAFTPLPTQQNYQFHKPQSYQPQNHQPQSHQPQNHQPQSHQPQNHQPHQTTTGTPFDYVEV